MDVFWWYEGGTVESLFWFIFYGNEKVMVVW